MARLSTTLLVSSVFLPLPDLIWSCTDLFSAGITDSALTNHGVLQAARLGTHLSSTGVKVTKVFSSDLQRAIFTADAVRNAQAHTPPDTIKLELLREQDFGFFERKKKIDRTEDGKSGKDTYADAHRDDPGFKDAESKEHMRSRMEAFVDVHLVPVLHDVQAEDAVVVVAHGIILNYLWRAILKQFKREDVMLAQDIEVQEFNLEHFGGWSNTGYLELEITPAASIGREDSVGLQPVADPFEVVQPPSKLPLQVTNATRIPDTKPTMKLLNMSLVVKAVNSQEHLKGLKKTRGGLGSLKHDSSQKTMDSFFKKRRTE